MPPKTSEAHYEVRSAQYNGGKREDVQFTTCPSIVEGKGIRGPAKKRSPAKGRSTDASANMRTMRQNSEALKRSPWRREMGSSLYQRTVKVASTTDVPIASVRMNKGSLPGFFFFSQLCYFLLHVVFYVSTVLV